MQSLQYSAYRIFPESKGHKGGEESQKLCPLNFSYGKDHMLKDESGVGLPAVIT